ncbi:putative U3 snoRNA-associated protein UTP11 [Leishmania major strain Friedlin]|uniref:Probable U3 small nucleolar RNA-associated protein 11 n=1 Tax=Leishmania major TaxID=5664 RepID=UTP11_LEIMA|nr:putative U3 snoRNA-associated protein UTP11 [Leishmania major strain Friedlin]Q9U178.1 RecName: Full=Probable U3 small nucleolar RNA-associated protein 11; Short=U3 snoRNA-associated protein 11 [Leishmania major]CAG9572754.1 U3_snoRNA-associated_protein_UTP11_-_putative [Leishmania major strain Friedlin]CAJ07152.1 putative U3 snoRNA-associated protein UTP11 [Leishmania major strain Friedlin]|eukprot:XP_001682644.1 putative U3 snoRNA-associated protein UTP11 [Leishmania major strain Friedlin]
MTKGKGRNPGASGLDKHLKRKTHLERSQPKSRQHLGQLEKHKDHVLRAKKRKVKVRRLQEIKRAAAQRNPDEFNIGMTKAVMDVANGRMRQRRVRLVESDRKKDMQTTIEHNRRNVQYLEFKAQADQQRATELLNEEAAAALTSTAPQNKHIVFVNSEEEFRSFNPLKHFDVTPEMMRQHPAVRGRIRVLEKTVMPEEILMSGGHQIKSAAQKRKERREVQEKMRRSGADATPETRAAFVERLRAKKELKQYQFTDLLEEVKRESEATASSSKGAPGDDGEQEEAAAQDEVTRLLEWRREQERQAAIATARHVREVGQRIQRSKSLSALAKSIRKQSQGIKRQMEQRRESRFKPGATRRAR